MTWRSAVCSLCLAIAPAAFACSVSGDESGPAGSGGDDGDTVGPTGTSATSTGEGGGGLSGAGGDGGLGVGGGAPECLTSCAEGHQDGATIYALLHTCVYCQACFVTCDAASLKCERPMLPSVCDVSQDCDGCKKCALEGECNDELAACEMAPDCLEYGNCIAACAIQ